MILAAVAVECAEIAIPLVVKWLIDGAIAVSHHALTIGGLVAFITLALQLIWPVEALGYVLASGEEAATAAQRVLEIFDTQPAITDETRLTEDHRQEDQEDQKEREPATPSGAMVTEGARMADSVEQAHVQFDHVSFSYAGNPAPILRDVSLEVRRGETLVLTGATGSGKTTLLSLVPRLADVTAGRVLLGGTDVRDIPLAELRAKVGCAFEEATLFSASVRENVTFGAPDATEEQVDAALTAAQARFAFDLPWGLDTRTPWPPRRTPSRHFP
jgi:ATP-binding cassette subfamily B protein